MTNRCRVVVGLAMVVLLSAGPGVPAAEPTEPAFAEPRAQTSHNDACAPGTFSATRSPDNRVLSIIRRTKFLEVANGGKRKAKARCAIELLLEKPLVEPRTLYLDLRGDEMKEADSRISYVLRLARQHHRIEYNRGRVLDAATDSSFKRFQVLNLPKGTRRIPLVIEGAAESLDGKSFAYVAIDSFDLCFSDPAAPDRCGGIAKPEPGAKPVETQGAKP